MQSRSLAWTPLFLACLLPACGSDGQNDAMVNAVVEATDVALRAIEEDETWLNDASIGQDISGSLSNEVGGTLTAGGWRASSQYENDGGVHLTYGERLVLQLNQWEGAGVLMSGTLSVTRHSLDHGPSGGNIEDASRTTRYLGQLDAEGAAEGSFAVDIHAFASGSVLWTCGTVNDEDVEFGRCY